MRTITYREYDDEGRLIRETTVRDDKPVTSPTDCTCMTPWNSILPPPPCPVHGQAMMPPITCTANTIPVRA